MQKDIMDEISELLDDYTNSVLDYTNSQTCDFVTYKAQELAMYTAKYKLLNKIGEVINKA